MSDLRNNCQHGIDLDLDCVACDLWAEGTEMRHDARIASIEDDSQEDEHWDDNPDYPEDFEDSDRAAAASERLEMFRREY